MTSSAASVVMTSGLYLSLTSSEIVQTRLAWQCPGRITRKHRAQSISLPCLPPWLCCQLAACRYGLIAVDSKGDAMQLEKASLSIQIASGFWLFLPTLENSAVTAHAALRVVPWHCVRRRSPTMLLCSTYPKTSLKWAHPWARSPSEPLVLVSRAAILSSPAVAQVSAALMDALLAEFASELNDKKA